MSSAARALEPPCFAGCSSGRMAISDLWPSIFCAALTISPVIARNSDFERVFLPQPARNRRMMAAHAAKIRTTPREFKFKRPVAARRASAGLLGRLRKVGLREKIVNRRMDFRGGRHAFGGNVLVARREIIRDGEDQRGAVVHFDQLLL